MDATDFFHRSEELTVPDQYELGKFINTLASHRGASSPIDRRRRYEAIKSRLAELDRYFHYRYGQPNDS